MIFISVVWHVPPEPQSGRVTELPKSEEKKLEVGGGDIGPSWPNELRSYVYYSYNIHFETEKNKLHAIYLITYFKNLFFHYLTTRQTSTQNNLGFSHAVICCALTSKSWLRH